jgi:diguanylate cyclase with GGDEF domain
MWTFDLHAIAPRPLCFVESRIGFIKQLHDRAYAPFMRRYGGEEFLVVLNNCDPAFAFARAEEVRNTIAQRPVQTSTGPVAVTMSLGLLLSPHEIVGSHRSKEAFGRFPQDLVADEMAEGIGWGPYRQWQYISK